MAPLRKLPIRERLGRHMARNFPALLAQWRRRTRAAAVAPGAPQNLTATDASPSVRLNWSAGTGTVTGLRVYRKVDAGPDVLYVTLGAAVLTYLDTGVTDGPTYTYSVAAYNAFGQSPRSNSAVITLAPPP